MKSLWILLMLGCSIYGWWWVNRSHPEVKNKLAELIDIGYFHTLEVRYTANQIMETHQGELLKDHRHKYLEPMLKFYPYLLLEVKYTLSDEKTKESVILWDLTDGEMVLETKRWEKTHGFGDCINANAQRHEFRILSLLARKGGVIDRTGLSKALHVDSDILDAWIEGCRRKKLIVQAGNRYRIHLQNPLLAVIPETKIDERLVTKPFKKAIRIPQRFSLAQVEKVTRAAFGNDFSIRKTTDVYLPVHSISVQNPDGSIHTSHWNALNGKRLSDSLFYE